MDAALSANTDTSLVRGFSGGRGSGFPDMQLDVLRGMLSSLETLTESGQRYTMAKMVAFIRRRIPSSGFTLSPRNAATIGDIVERLEGETTGLMVDAERFVARAGTLLDLLDAVVWQRHAGDHSFRTDRTNTGLDQGAATQCD